MRGDFWYSLSQFDAEFLLTPVRTKKDFLLVKIRALTILLYSTSCIKSPRLGEFAIGLHIDKMSRINVYGKNKIFSFHLPFKLINNGTSLLFHTRSGLEVDAGTLSYIENLIGKLDILESEDLGVFFDFFVEKSMDEGFAIDEKKVWRVLMEFLLLEECYLRYDVDHDGFKKEQPHLHPVHHIDLFYSAGGTFKLGLKSSIQNDIFLDLLSTKTDCKYISI